MTGEVRRGASVRVFAWLTVLLTLPAGASAQARSVQSTGRLMAPEPYPPTAIHDLSLAESIPFSLSPPLMLLSETKCDLKGKIYLVQSGSSPSLLGSNGLSTVPVSELSISTKSTLTYPVPNLDRYRGVIRSDFDVSADGHLYALIEALDASPTEREPTPSFFVAKYKDDGSLDSFFKLEDAPNVHIQPFRFAMFRDGNVLVTGTAVAAGKPLRPFIGVLDSAGRFLTHVKAPGRRPAPSNLRSPISKEKDGVMTVEAESSDPESDIAVSLSSSSFMVSAPDGNVYLLRSETRPRLYVISPAGELIRNFEVPEFAAGLTATNMGMAGNDRVFITFGRVQGGSAASADADGPSSLIAVVSPDTGQVSGVYRLPKEGDAADVPACAFSSTNFLFVGATADHQHQQVTRYVPR